MEFLIDVFLMLISKMQSVFDGCTKLLSYKNTVLDRQWNKEWAYSEEWCLFRILCPVYFMSLTTRSERQKPIAFFKYVLKIRLIKKKKKNEKYTKANNLVTQTEFTYLLYNREK